METILNQIWHNNRDEQDLDRIKDSLNQVDGNCFLSVFSVICMLQYRSWELGAGWGLYHQPSHIIDIWRDCGGLVGRDLPALVSVT